MWGKPVKGFVCINYQIGPYTAKTVGNHNGLAKS